MSTNANSLLVADLISMIALFSPKKTVSEESRLYHDLGISGDDALELLEKIRSKYETDFSEMHFPDYFPNEGQAVGHRILRTTWVRTQLSAYYRSHVGGCRIGRSMEGRQLRITSSAAR